MSTKRKPHTVDDPLLSGDGRKNNRGSGDNMEKARIARRSKTMAERLSIREAAFIREYSVDFNATAAAIRAGYSKSTAGAIGHEYLGKPKIKDALAKYAAEKMAEIDFSATRVLKELARLAMFDPAKLFNEDGSVKAIHEMDENSRMAIAGFEVVELPGGKGVLKKFRLADKGANLERLGRYHKLFTAKQELTGAGGGPLQLQAVPNFKEMTNEQLQQLLKRSGHPVPLLEAQITRSETNDN
jgi:phage terminase small subunit